MRENVTVYGVGDLHDALKSIGASPRQLSYLVAKGHITPSVKLPGRLGYTTDDLARVFLMLGPLSPIDLPTRMWAAGSVIDRVFNERMGPADEEAWRSSAEFDLEPMRTPTIKLKVDKREMMADFAAFMGRVAGAPANIGATTDMPKDDSTDGPK